MKVIILIILILAISNLAHAAPFNKFLDSNKLFEKTPEELMQDYQEGKINSSQLWIKMPLDKKIELIDLLKERFKEEEGVIINKPSETYAVLLENLFNQYPELLTESIKAIFAALAMQQDDFYEEGLSLGESMKKWFGENFLINETQTYGTK